MAVPERHGDLDIEKDIKAQQREWKAQHVGQFVFLAILLAAMLGMFGSGPLSETQRTSGDIAVTYKRLARWEAPAVLNITIQRRDATQHSIEIWIDRNYLRAMEVKSITPMPQRDSVAEDRIIYEFPLAADARHGTMTFILQPKEFGLKRARVGQPGGDELAFSQFIFP